MARIVMKPSSDEANKAIEILEKAIREDSSSARAPWERSTPDDTPIWTPARWSLGYISVRRNSLGWIWRMETSDQQVVAYTWIRQNTSTTYVTHNGTERRQEQNALPYHPTAMMKDWFPWETKYKKLVVPA